MSAAPDYSSGWPAASAADLAGLLAAAAEAVDSLAGNAELAVMADDQAAAVMGALTTLVGRLDGLRVGVAQLVAERGLYGQRAARNLAGWLRADARVADDAWKLARLAVAAPDLPKITALLEAGTVSLSQAATACWQVSQLPDLPRRPPEVELPCSATPGSEPAGDATPQADRPGLPDAPGAIGEPGDPHSGPCVRDLAGGQDPAGAGGGAAPDASAGGDRWAGLWRLGNVHAAADELFSGVLPGLDSGQLRQLGAHLREAAAPEQRAGEDHGDFARRGLRVSRSLAGCGEITGRLHAEAAEQVIAAFDELGARTGPGDTRTKAQRWADALTRLCATATAAPQPAAPSATGTQPYAGQSLADRQYRPGQAHPQGWPDQDQAAGPPDGGPWPAGFGDGTGHHHGGTPTDGHAHRGHAGPVPAGYQRPRLIVTVPLATLLGQPLAAGATILGPGTPLTGAAARRLACDAQIIRLVTNPIPHHPTSTSPPTGSGWPSTGPPGSTLPGSGPPRTGAPSTADPPGADRLNGGPRGVGPCARPPGSTPHRGGTATGDLTARLAAGLAQLPPPLAGPSAVLDIGRASPGWTPRQRDALAAQYGGRCAQPGCGSPIDVLHHIVHWADGGPTSTRNGLPLCLYHHWLIHEGGWRVLQHTDGTITAIPPPPGWRPGTTYRHGKPLPEH